MKIFSTTYKAGKFILVFGLIAILFFAVKTCNELRDRAQNAEKELEDFTSEQGARAERLESEVAGAIKGLRDEVDSRRNAIDEFVDRTRENGNSGEENSEQQTEIENKIEGLDYIGGDSEQSCQTQGHDCGLDLYCPDDQWIRSKNSRTCCTTVCTERIQSSYEDNELGRVTIEKVSSGYLAWYGNSLSFSQLGPPNSAVVYQDLDDIYKFVAQNSLNRFRIVDNSDSSFNVENADS